MQDSTKEFAMLLLTQRVNISHKLNIIKKFDTKPEYIPLSARFKFKLTCCEDLINDANQQSDADEISRKIQELQALIREKTRNTVEREINLLKGKMIKILFKFLFKTMKTGFILFKANNKKLKFNKTDNTIIKSGIIEYFQEQDHNHYYEYFLLDKNLFLNHLYNLKNDLFNDEELSNDIPPTSTTTNASNHQETLNEIPSDQVLASKKEEFFRRAGLVPNSTQTEPNKDLLYSESVLDNNCSHTPSHQDGKYSRTVRDDYDSEENDDVVAANSDDYHTNSQRDQKENSDADSTIESGSLISESSLVKLSKELTKNQKKNSSSKIPSEVAHNPTEEEDETQTLEENETGNENSNPITPSRQLTLHSEGFDNLQAVYYVKNHLKNILPHLTYKLLQNYNKKMELKQGEKMAEAFYSNFEYNQATEATAAALESETKLAPDTLGDMVTEIAGDVFDHKFKSSLKKVTFKPSSDKMSKNFEGGQKSLSQPIKNGATEEIHQSHTPQMSNNRKRKRSSATNSGKTKMKIRRLDAKSNRTLKENVRNFQEELSAEEKQSKKN